MLSGRMYQAMPNKVIKFAMKQAEILGHEYGYYRIMCSKCFMVNSEEILKPEMECIFCETIYSVKKGGGDGLLEEFWSKMQRNFIKVQELRRE